MIQLPPCSLEHTSKWPSCYGEAQTSTRGGNTQRGPETTGRDRCSASSQRLPPQLFRFPPPPDYSCESPYLVRLPSWALPNSDPQKPWEVIKWLLLFLATKFWGKLNIAVETGVHTIQLSLLCCYQPPRLVPHHLARPGVHTGGPVNISGWAKANSMSTGFVGGIRILNVVRPEFCDNRFLLTLQNYWSRTPMSPKTRMRYISLSQMKQRKGRETVRKMSIIKSYENRLFRLYRDSPPPPPNCTLPGVL